MLSRLVHDVVEQIQNLEFAKQLPTFTDQLHKARPELFEQIRKDQGPQSAQEAGRLLAGAQLRLIRDIPFLVQSIQDAVEQQTTHPAVRCAMVGALAYLVNPLDLLPDNLPAGFGYVDDCMILRSTVSEYFDILPPGFTSAERERMNLRLLALCFPVDQLAKAQAGIDGVWHLFHRLLLMAPDQVEAKIQQLKQNPLEISLSPQEPAPSPYPPGPDLRMALRPGAIYLETGCLHLGYQDGLALIID